MNFLLISFLIIIFLLLIIIILLEKSRDKYRKIIYYKAPLIKIEEESFLKLEKNIKTHIKKLEKIGNDESNEFGKRIKIISKITKNNFEKIKISFGNIEKILSIKLKKEKFTINPKYVDLVNSIISTIKKNMTYISENIEILDMICIKNIEKNPLALSKLKKEVLKIETFVENTQQLIERIEILKISLLNLEHSDEMDVKIIEINKDVKNMIKYSDALCS